MKAKPASAAGLSGSTPVNSTPPSVRLKSGIEPNVTRRRPVSASDTLIWAAPAGTNSIFVSAWLR